MPPARRTATTLVLALAGCPSPRESPPDAGTPAPDAPPDAAFYERRPATSVIVGPDRVAWSQLGEGCPLEGSNACPEVGPTVTTGELDDDGVVVTWVATRFGANNIVGDPDEVFIHLGTHVGRIRPWSGDDLHPMTAALWYLGGPAVDATHVFWFEGAPNGAPMQIRRATRAGDGSDVVTLATEPLHYVRQMTTLGGYLWWTSDGLHRIPVTGGPIELVLAHDGNVTSLVIAAASPDAIYVTRGIEVTPTGPWETQLLRVHADGSFDLLLDHLTAQEEPMLLVVDGDELFWRTSSQRLFHAPISDLAAATEVPDAGSGPFGVTPTAILVDFTRRGFRSLPR